MLIPQIKGDYVPLFKPEKHGNYINDHTIVRDNGGVWHLFGITGFGGGSFTERYFVHAKGADLSSPMSEYSRVIDRGTLAWAPCVITGRDGFYYMFFGPSPTQLAVSPDMQEWFGYNIRIENEPPMAIHRDHFVFDTGDGTYLMYAAGIRNGKSSISVSESHDLLNWKFIGFALTSGESAPLNPAWGAMESPYVIALGGRYYLFITYTNSDTATYNDTLVFSSENPLDFGTYSGGDSGAVPVAKLYAHAPEIIADNGRFYITTCGWNGKPNPCPGTVSIAELEWTEKP